MSILPPELAELAAVAAFAPHLAQAFASLACDMALVLDAQGVVTRVAHNPTSPLAALTTGWVGKPLVDTVTRQTRPKVQSLLREVAQQGLARRREVNLPAGPGEEIPVAYTALRLGPEGPTLAVGQDLRAVALLQQRFLRVQQELERGYGLAVRAADEAHEPIDEASRVAFAAWLKAERLSAEPAPVAPPSERTARPRRRR
jgi:hypothetical protein